MNTDLRNTLSNCLLIIFGIFIHAHLLEIIITKQFHEKRMDRIGDYYITDMVTQRSGLPFVLKEDTISVFDQNRDHKGYLNDKIEIYVEDTLNLLNDTLIRIEIYGWVWIASLDNNCCLIADENIRYRANSNIIGRFNKGVCFDTIYANELMSWMLIRLNAFVNKKNLFSNNDFRKQSWLKRKYARLIQPTVTQRYGGLAVKPFERPILRESNLRCEIRIALLVFLFVFVNIIALGKSAVRGRPMLRKLITNLAFEISGFGLATIFWFT